MANAKYAKTRKEFEADFQERMIALRSHAQSYDNGNIWSAKDLSNDIYILIHDGRRGTKSLLGILGLKKDLRILSQVDSHWLYTDPRVLSRNSNKITHIQMRDRLVEFVPKFQSYPVTREHLWLKHSEWWEECIFAPMTGPSLSRKNIVFSMANQDGGRHTDTHLTDEAYIQLSRRGDPIFSVFDGALGAFSIEGEPVKNGAAATMRQIAWELDFSLQQIGF
jgi:hypothetical protein